MFAAVNQTEPRRCADRAVELLLAAGVERMFGVPGGAISPLYDALRGSALPLVMGQHEAMAVYAAMGRYHETGALQAVAVTSGPGVMNTLTPVAAACADEVPLLVLAGEVRTAWAGRGALQDGGVAGLDVGAVFRPVVRDVVTLERAEDLPEVFERARLRAMSHPRGPVLIRMPVDLLGATVEAADLPQQAPSDGPIPVPAMVAAIARELRSARRPVFFAGVGARAAGAGPALERLAWRLRAGVVTDIEAKGLVDEAEPLSLGAYGVGSRGAANRWLDDGVDLLITVGARLDDTATGGFSDALRARRMIQLDHDPARLGRPWKPDVAVHTDLVQMLEALLTAVGYLPAAEIVRRDGELRAIRHRPEGVSSMSAAPFHPAAVIASLQSAFGEKARFTADIGNHMLFATRYLVANDPTTFRMSNGLGGMGSGIGLAIGIATATAPDVPVVAICGDGGMLMVGNELATCARYQIPVVFAVFDNRSLGMISHGMQRVYGVASACEVPDIDLVSFAQSLGVPAIDVTSEDDLARAASLRGRGPLLLRIPVDGAVEIVNPRDAGFVREATRA